MQPYELLSTARINGVFQGLQDVRLLPGAQMIWADGRIANTPALDEEIIARFIDYVQIADIIADDAEAVTYQQGKFQFETNKIPNLKHGTAMNQALLNQLSRLNGLPMGGDDLGLFTNWENRTLTKLLLGVRQRKELLDIGMLTDSVVYDRLGMKVSATWGMPSDLKVTPANGWDDATNGTPITDINTVRRNAQARYGKTYNRATMSTSALQYAVKTTEFLNQAKLFGFGMFSGIPAPAIPLQSDSMLRDMFQRIISGTSGGFTIEIDDRRYQSQDVNGNGAFYPFLPITKVILTDSADDGNRAAYDWAQGEVTEAIVSRLAPTNIVGGKIPGGFGPRAYATGNPSLNPPNIQYWAVERGFPRKHQLQASACLTVGTFTDTIAVGVPFPS